MIIPPPPEINVTIGSNVCLDPTAARIIFIFGMPANQHEQQGPTSDTLTVSTCSASHPPGGPGSGKGRIVANLRSMFGMKLISGENIVLKYLPKKVQHSMELTSTEVRDIQCHVYTTLPLSLPLTLTPSPSHPHRRWLPLFVRSQAM